MGALGAATGNWLLGRDVRRRGSGSSSEPQAIVGRMKIMVRARATPLVPENTGGSRWLRAAHDLAKYPRNIRWIGEQIDERFERPVMR